MLRWIPPRDRVPASGAVHFHDHHGNKPKYLCNVLSEEPASEAEGWRVDKSRAAIKLAGVAAPAEGLGDRDSAAITHLLTGIVSAVWAGNDAEVDRLDAALQALERGTACSLV